MAHTVESLSKLLKKTPFIKKNARSINIIGTPNQ